MSNGVAHGDLTLFDCPRVRRGEYWQFIKLVAPAHADALPAGQTHWLSQDASDAFCLKCEKMFRFLKGSSNSVRRHMERFHKSELLRHQARADDMAKKSGSSTSSSSSSSSSSALSKALERAADKRPLPDALDVPPSSPASDRPQSGAAAASKETLARALAHRSSSGHKKVRTSTVGAFEQRHASDLLVKWLCRSLRAPSVVEDAGFADFVAYVSGGGAQSFVVPDRAAVRHRRELLVESARFELKQRAKRELGDCALSLERWHVAPPDAATGEREAFVALTCHGLTADFVPITWTLDVLPLRPDDDAATFAAHLSAVVRDWGVQKQALALLVSGDDARLTSAGRALELPSVSDVRVVLEQVLSQSARQLSAEARGATDPAVLRASDALKDAPSILSTTLAELQAFAQTLRASAAASNKVLELCSAVADTERLVLKDPRSWTSIYAFLVHVVRCTASLDRLVAFGASPDGRKALADGAPALTPPPSHLWFVAEALVLVLQPFNELANVVAGERACSLPLILPCLAVVRQQLARDDLFADLVLQYRTAASASDEDAALDNAVAQLETFRQRVLRAFAHEYDALCAAFDWCAALDPRYGRLRHVADDDARETCKRSLTERAMALAEQQLPPAVASTEALSGLTSAFDSDLLDSSSSARAPATATQGLMHRLLYDDDEDGAASSPETLSRDAELAQTKLYVANEVQLYVSEHQARKTRIADPLQWWRANRERYPFLAPLARMWLGTVASSPASSSPLERQVPVELWRDAVERSNSSDSSSDSRERARKTTADTLFLHANLRAESEASL